MYIISHDSPEQQLELYDAMKERFGYSLPFVSDPKLELVDQFGMKNGDVAFRGYGMLDENGNILFKTANDHWGEEFDKTVEEIKEEYNKLKKK